MSNHLKKLISEAKKINFPFEKKDLIRARIQDFINLTPVTKNLEPIKSTFYISKFAVLNISKVVSFSLIILLVGGSTMSYASENSLPGDSLYTVKVNIKEPIETKLAFTPQTKLEVKTKQVEKRLSEAQTLIQRNDMSPEKHKEVEVRLEKKVEEISKTIDGLQEKGDVETILLTTSKLQPVLKAHKENLKREVELKKAQETEKDIQVSLMTTMSLEIESATEIPNENNDVSQINILSTQASPSISEEKVEEDPADFSSTLLKTIERTLLQVEERETKVLETITELEKNNQTNSINISNVTNKKVEEAAKGINQIKNSIETKALVVSDENQKSEEILIKDIQTIDTELKQDLLTITVAEAELLLAESKNLFEQGLYKESLTKAQEAIKTTATIEVNKKIDAVKDRESFILEQTSLNTKKLIETQIKSIQKTETTIKIEEQASQAIKSLENSLNSKP